MKFAIDVPNFGPWADPHLIHELARAVEDSGWDGLSLWDHILYFSGNPVGDPWILLATAADATERIKLLMLVTPVPRRRPWVLARQCVTLDQLSGGRLVLGVGIGSPPGPEFGAFGEPTDTRTRADLLDEGLAIIDGMWTGEPFSFSGSHFTIEEYAFQPTPVQQPRIPIWVAGAWPNKRPFRRAAQWDGLAPIVQAGDDYTLPTAAQLAEMMAYVRQHRDAAGPYDVAVPAILPDDVVERAEYVAAFEDAGATWFRLGPDPTREASEFLTWVRNGPPD